MEENMENVALEEDISAFLLDDDETADQPETDQSASSTESEPKPESSTPEPPAEQPAEAPAGETQPPERPAGDDETFQLKYMDETRTVKREELISLAQQGLDYGRMRQQRDQLTADNQELKKSRDESAEMLDAFTQMAQENGMTLEQFADNARVGLLMKRENLTREVAQERIARERAERQLAQAQKREEARSAEDEETRQRNEDIDRFLKTHPDVKPNDVPQSVWDRVKRGESLLTAYDAVMTEKALEDARAENERLKGELEAQKQNRKNQQTTIGSQTTNEGDSGKDPFLAAFMADD